MPITLDLMRHGEPVGGRRYRGQTDDPLSEQGWAQMRAACGLIAPWSRIVTSPLLRCRAFAEELAAQRGLPLYFENRFKEIGFGVWEGKTALDIEREAPGTLVRFKTDPLHKRPDGAEPLADFYARVAAGLGEILAHHDGEHVLVVCHAGVIRMALAYALESPWRMCTVSRWRVPRSRGFVSRTDGPVWCPMAA
jgi:alpha-ribazole phosphatase